MEFQKKRLLCINPNRFPAFNTSSWQMQHSVLYSSVCSAASGCNVWANQHLSPYMQCPYLRIERRSLQLASIDRFRVVCEGMRGDCRVLEGEKEVKEVEVVEARGS